MRSTKMHVPNLCLVGRLSLDAMWAGTYRWPSRFSQGADHKPVWDRFIPTSGTELCSLFWFSLQGRLDFSNWCWSLPSLLYWLSRKPSAFHPTSPKLAHDNDSSTSTQGHSGTEASASSPQSRPLTDGKNPDISFPNVSAMHSISNIVIQRSCFPWVLSRLFQQRKLYLS